MYRVDIGNQDSSGIEATAVAVNTLVVVMFVLVLMSLVVVMFVLVLLSLVLLCWGGGGE